MSYGAAAADTSMARRESAGATATGAAELGAGLAGGEPRFATGAAIVGTVAGEGVSLGLPLLACLDSGKAS
ncbi:MAG: hypothetical protein M3186_14215, partial [Actinomycetota bacterium]|nr:hypothetical protein [Actinomycetota bacterium]